MLDRIRSLLITLLILAIGFSPRIPLGIFIPGRRFDLRIVDIVLVVICLFWILYLMMRPYLHLTSLAKPIGLYLGICFITTFLSLVFLSRVSLLRSFFYFLKEVEYFLIFFVVANWVSSKNALLRGLQAIIVSGLANVSWVVYQLISGKNGPLFKFLTPEGAFDRPRIFASYGPTLIGEASPLSIACFFSFLFLLSLCCAYFWTAKRKLFFLLAFLFLPCALLSGTKMSLGLILVGGFVLLLRFKMKRKIFFFLFILTLLMFISGGLLYHIPIAGRAFHFKSYLTAIFQERLLFVWKPIFFASLNYFLTGVGKGAVVLPGFGFVDETHCHYLKVFIDSGIFGLLAFIVLILSVIKLSWKIGLRSRFIFTKIFSAATLGIIVSLAIAAVYHDVFRPFVPNELLWVFIGLACASWRIERKSLQNSNGIV
ncbi:MAG: hypothetical protein JW734_08970 [Candidatus Omnitrophica bacterium]|nr:hypothetical protein [Candidatus Omnitrophota bacterium]